MIWPWFNHVNHDLTMVTEKVDDFLHDLTMKNCDSTERDKIHGGEKPPTSNSIPHGFVLGTQCIARYLICGILFCFKRLTLNVDVHWCKLFERFNHLMFGNVWRCFSMWDFKLPLFYWQVLWLFTLSWHLAVSWKLGTPKSSIYRWDLSILNQPFWIPIFFVGKLHVFQKNCWFSVFGLKCRESTKQVFIAAF